MTLKCAWIDHEGYNHIELVGELKERGIRVEPRATLDLFLQDLDLNDYPVLLYHPGIRAQHRLREVVERFPHTTVAVIVQSCSREEYQKYDLPILSYNPDEVAEFVRKNTPEEK